MVIALHYPTPTNIKADSQELAIRWNNYVFDPSGPFLEDDIPLNQACSPLSVHTVQHTEHSTIVGSCLLKKNETTPSATFGPSFWLWLFQTKQLEFLATDIEDLK